MRDDISQAIAKDCFCHLEFQFATSYTVCVWTVVILSHQLSCTLLSNKCESYFRYLSRGHCEAVSLPSPSLRDFLLSSSELLSLMPHTHTHTSVPAHAQIDTCALSLTSTTHPLQYRELYLQYSMPLAPPTSQTQEIPESKKHSSPAD